MSGEGVSSAEKKRRELRQAERHEAIDRIHTLGGIGASEITRYVAFAQHREKRMKLLRKSKSDWATITDEELKQRGFRIPGSAPGQTS